MIKVVAKNIIKEDKVKEVLKLCRELIGAKSNEEENERINGSALADPHPNCLSFASATSFIRNR